MGRLWSPLSRTLSPMGVAGLAAFTPLSLSPALWLKADGTLWQDSARTTTAVADGDPVGAWDDASGNARHAAQATAGKRPSLKASIQNGRPVLRYDGVDDILTIPAFATFPSKRGSICAVMKRSSGAWGTIISTYAGFGAFEWDFAATADSGFKPYYFFDGSTSRRVESSADVAAFAVLTLIRNTDTNVDFRRNGVARLSITVADRQADATKVVGVGAMPFLADFLNGDFAELLMFDQALTAPEYANVEAYLNSRWAIY